MRRAIIVAVAILGTALAALGSVAWWLRAQDSLASLPREPAPAAAATTEEWREAWRGRTLVHVALHTTAVGVVRFVVTIPDPLPAHPIPLVVVLGGLRGGSNSIRELTEVGGDPGPNAIVGYDWPLPDREPGVAEIVARLPSFRRGALSAPGQVDVLIAWATRQPWIDARRVSVLAYSLGAFAAPATHALVSARGGEIGWTILAYAGAPIGDVIAGHPGVRPRWLARGLGTAADLLLRPLDPTRYLPHMHGRFLLLGGSSDRLVAPAAAERMRALTPEPRTVVLLEGDHMGRGATKNQLLARVIAESRSWLVGEGAIDPAR